ncbi:unnamed protein product [Gongylonema pulchrum]|uniref:Eukaryotic translation initiation factor 6 n=1 Tax=Gongylonema pulchrum TaxID=637853 RepID=A0A183EFI5_9BILA|nr:unnamed protein product [Gongylonema pulchrum]
MALRCQFEASNDVGVFAKLTNSYCLIGIVSGRICTLFGIFALIFSVVESELADVIPVIHCSIAGTRIVGRVTAGNRKGLLVPNATTDQELQHIRNSLPDNVKIRRVDEKLSALGNVIACNDHVALVHPEISKETTQVCSDFFRFFRLIGIRLKYLSPDRLDFCSESSSIIRIRPLINFFRK